MKAVGSRHSLSLMQTLHPDPIAAIEGGSHQGEGPDPGIWVQKVALLPD